MADFRPIKLPGPFVAWCKIEAEGRGVPMYVLVESLVEIGLGGARPWDYLPLEMVRRRPTRTKRTTRKHRYR